MAERSHCGVHAGAPPSRRDYCLNEVSYRSALDNSDPPSLPVIWQEARIACSSDHALDPADAAAGVSDVGAGAFDLFDPSNWF